MLFPKAMAGGEIKENYNSLSESKAQVKINKKPFIEAMLSQEVYKGLLYFFMDNLPVLRH